MTILIGILILIILGVIIVQVGKINELAAKLRGEKKARRDNNESNARLMLVFMVLFLVFCVGSAWYYKNMMLGYGPHESASLHGVELDYLFNVTLFFTGIVFVATQILLFWFAFRYREQEGRKALYMPHDNKLELIWTGIPAIVMSILVVYGLAAWNDTMADVDTKELVTGFVNAETIGKDSTYIEVEATGMQFLWVLRHPGRDGKLGERDYTLINSANPVGQVWTDPKNIDDFHMDELILPVGQKVRVRITSRDVLHNFDLPHFRVKMDAVPGFPTYFVFTPTLTTEQYRENLSRYPEWNVPADPEDPTGPKRWETFEYELACAELCGKSHYSMKKIVKIVSPEEYNEWLASMEHTSQYLREVRNKVGDPFLGRKLLIEKNIADYEKAKEEAEKTAPEPAPAPEGEPANPGDETDTEETEVEVESEEGSTETNESSDSQ